MNIASFFCGAGGLDLGFILAGHSVIWANDFDKAAVSTYNANIGRYTGHNAMCCDIVDLLNKSKDEIAEIIPDCDIITGGFPCQGFTVANTGRSMKDSRNFLYLQLLKAISVKQPPFFLLENVKGLESIEKGKVLPMILQDLEKAGTPNCKVFEGTGVGYSIVYNVLNAYDFGVPQNRERVIILGIRKDVPLGSLADYIADMPVTKNNLHKRLYIAPTHLDKAVLKDPLLPKDKVNRLYKALISGTESDWIYSTDRPVYKTTTMQDAIGDLPLEYSEETTIANHCGSMCKVRINQYLGNRATDWKQRSPTIMGRGSGKGGPLIPPHPEKHRRLSIRETARIQTFPDDFVFYGSNSECYRQIGNAVPVLMAYAIAQLFVQREADNLAYRKELCIVSM